MEPEDIADLRAKGRAAGAALATEFRWETHRLRRFQSTMRLLAGHLGPDGFARGYHDAFDRVLREDLRAVRAELRDRGLDDREVDRIMEALRMGLGHRWAGAAAQRIDRLLDDVQRWDIFVEDPPPVPEATLRVGPDV